MEGIPRSGTYLEHNKPWRHLHVLSPKGLQIRMYPGVLDHTGDRYDMHVLRVMCPLLLQKTMRPIANKEYWRQVVLVSSVAVLVGC